MRASPNGVPLSAADSSRPLSGLLAAATPLESLLVEMYVLRVEPTLLCGRLRIPVKPATQSGESGHPVGAKRRWGFHDVSGGRFESM